MRTPTAWYPSAKASMEAKNAGVSKRLPEFSSSPLLFFSAFIQSGLNSAAVGVGLNSAAVGVGLNSAAVGVGLNPAARKVGDGLNSAAPGVGFHSETDGFGFHSNTPAFSDEDWQCIPRARNFYYGHSC